MAGLTHFDEHGASRMVDVMGKAVTHRFARASVSVVMQPGTLALVRDKALAKGDVLGVARVAGIMAAKKTAELIPLCHPLGLDGVEIAFGFEGQTTLRIEVTARNRGPTGVEMEALTAAAVAALTVYDMVKAVDRGTSIEALRLEEKAGGKSGHYRRESEPDDPS